MKKYWHKFKRKLIVSFYSPSRAFEEMIRNMDRSIRQHNIRRNKGIFDLTEMD